jgi:hypothetical protein
MVDGDFLCGLVEGFYGTPWSHQHRMHLVEQLAALGFNTYFYAPKSDLNHRAIWRAAYDAAELELFRELVDSCNRYRINFVYGLSPGLDMRFSEEEERNRIKLRFDQLRCVGVRHFALLFDDLPGNINANDRGVYESLGAAHCDVTNQLFAWAHSQLSESRFLFCPTPYCDRMDRTQLGGAGYLDEVGRLLNPGVDILWTGPEIVSQEISVGSIERLTRRIRRPPIIWDNLFANDYDSRRHYCGPYSGRPRDLRSAVRGILINPNNEYALNFIPLRTLAAHLNGDGCGEPREAFLHAASEWLPHFSTVSEPLALDDLILLADCYYLPHTFGPNAERLLRLVEHLFVEPVDNWGPAYDTFTALNGRIQAATDRLSELCDRNLFDAWGRRTWELRNELQVIDTVLAQKAAGRDIDNGIEVDHCLPGTFRGGFLAKLERYLSIDGQSRIWT